MTPGPVPLPPEVREILSQAMIHHRTPEFERVLKSVSQKLKTTFLTEQTVFMHASTGSGAMESAIVNTLNPGDKILALVSGKFGERWRDMARRHGCSVTELGVPWGESVSLEQLEIEIKKTSFDAVFVQACETSTATVHPVRQIAELIRRTSSNTLLFVDAITAIGAMPLPMDEWDLDVVVSGSQKAFMLPTGLSFIALSERAWKKNASVVPTSMYFDLRGEKKALEKGETHFSSVVPFIRALDTVLDRLGGTNLSRAIERSQRLADVTRSAGEKLGFQIFSKAPSSSVTALVVPAHIDGVVLRDRLESEYNITVMGGQDQLKGKIIRIGHLGFITNDDMVGTFDCLTRAAIDLGGALNPTPEAMAQFVKDALAGSEEIKAI